MSGDSEGNAVYSTLPQIQEQANAVTFNLLSSMVIIQKGVSYLWIDVNKKL